MTTDNIQTPVGRFVTGSLTERNTTDYQNRPIPEEKQRFEFGVAIRKDDPGVQAMFQYLQGVAMKFHGNLPAVLNFDIDGYSWKLKDGDKASARGTVNPNTTGCWVFYFSSMFPINTCDVNDAIIPAENIKRGYFVDLVMNAANNEAQGAQAGIYLNPAWVRLVAFGEEIRGGGNPADAFKSAPSATLPPGASTTPVAGNPASASMMATPAPGAAITAAPTTAPAPATPTAFPSSPAPTPAHDFVQNAAPAVGPGIPR